MATMTALAVARYVNSGVDVRRDGLQSAPQPFAFYMTAEGHSCARKAVELLVFGSASIRTIPITGAFTMDVAALDAAIARDRDAGVRPIAVIATAGTTNTGASDDLAAIAEVCRRRAVWLGRQSVSPPGVEPGPRPSQSRVLPAHPEDRKYPDLDSNQGPDLRRVRCIRYTIGTFLEG